MAGYVAVGAVILFVFIGLVDASRGRRAARFVGSLGLLLAASFASHTVWQLFWSPDGQRVPQGLLAGLSAAAVTLGLVADGMNGHRTKAVGAPLALLVVAWLLPRAVERPPSTGGVFFVAALGLLAGSVAGGLLNRVLRALRSSQDDEEQA